ncbi:helix-turn-helix domain-containing protein [Fluviibacterium sp. DFM31]|uniref:Helix-turn-helix domain-containing protein n=1 Tax=Meridianimarinicoccus marinus TaxID=3231483 RepID=A0ABV3L9Q6_9RHOB
MARSDRHHFAQTSRDICSILRIDPARVMRRAGVSPDLLVDDGKGLTAAEVFAVWNAALEEARTPEACFNLAIAYAHGLFSPPTFAFSRSPTVAVGLQRLSLLKPGIGPCMLTPEATSHGLRLHLAPADPACALPQSIMAFDLICLLEMIRRHTGEEVVLQRAGLPSYDGNRQRLEDFLRCPLETAPGLLFELSDRDAARPLVADTPEIWATFPPMLQRRHPDAADALPIAARVRSALLELLPGGQSNAEAVSARLNLSKRSLQRHLARDGHSFQGILDATRTDLALHYLQDRGLPVEDIACLLAFSDANAFYRAFRGWTGMTPAQARRPVAQTA